MNYPNDFMKADWLNDSQKSKLMAVHNTIRLKDVLSQALDGLDLHDYKHEPYNYVKAISDMMKACSLNAVKEYIGGDSCTLETYELLERVRYFFELLNFDDFETILKIDKACQYSDETGSYDKNIDELYNKTREFHLKKLKALELKPA